jgi:riboflavin biosynthesis pyrimidine reductase
MQLLLPHIASPGPMSSVEFDLHAFYGDGWLDRGGVRANFVTSVDGAATREGLSRGLQTPGDNAVFAALRDLADVILVGASTAALEGYRPSRPGARRRAWRADHGLAEAPAIAVVSANLQLDLTARLYADAQLAPTVIVTGPSAPVPRRNDIADLAAAGTKLQLIEVAGDGSGGVDFSDAVAGLFRLGYRRIVCEGGPRLLAAGFRAQAIDEVCLSCSPIIAGPAGPRIVAGSEWPPDYVTKLELLGLLEENGALFSRYRVSR